MQGQEPPSKVLNCSRFIKLMTRSHACLPSLSLSSPSLLLPSINDHFSAASPHTTPPSPSLRMSMTHSHSLLNTALNTICFLCHSLPKFSHMDGSAKLFTHITHSLALPLSGAWCATLPINISHDSPILLSHFLLVSRSLLSTFSPSSLLTLRC